MFEAVELNKKISKKVFEAEVQDLRTELLDAQESIRTSGISVIVIISGVEGAGKSEVVNRLNEWLDARGIRNHAFWKETDEERMRPTQWRFWRAMPPAGAMAVMFGSWYTRPIVRHAMGDWDEDRLDAEMGHIDQLERMLCDDGVLVVKLWYHLSQKAQQQRIKDKKKNHVNKYLKRYGKNYKTFIASSARAIRLTDSGNAPWHLIDAEDWRYRDLKTGKVILMSLKEAMARYDAAASNGVLMQKEAKTSAPLSGKSVFDSVDVDKSLAKPQYRKQLKKYQDRLHDLSWQAHNAKRSVVALFEGWDAAGKGGAIRRLTAAMDARIYSALSVAAPTDEEKAHHYLWRFWRHLPMDGYITLYDRSWYGRVLVERVEGFATLEQWSRAYREINDFEEHLYRHGIILAKFWVHITPEEQLRRFREREVTPWKQHKITEEDWRNRQRWSDYGQAITDMVERTSTAYAPWTLVPGNDKKVARVEIIKTLCERIEQAL
ncbi:MAG: polyphosphate:AMP phosphotransferase [Gammaproteobacteria bacterium]